MNTPKISIIVPVYNVESYLEKCISSILAQTHRDFELILVDDGSTDVSPEICQRYAQIDSRIIVILNSQNSGVSVARNMGVAAASGDYICFVDSDDYIADTYLEFLYKNAIHYNADVSFCQFKVVYGNSDPLGNNTHKTCNNIKICSKDNLWERLAESKGIPRATLVIVCNKLIRKEIANQLSFPVGKWHEDVFYTNYLWSIANTIVETDAQLYFYRQRPNSITSTENHLDPRHIDESDAYKESVDLCRQSTTKTISKKMLLYYRDHLFKMCKRYGRGKVTSQLYGRLIKSYIQHGYVGIRQLKKFAKSIIQIYT